MGKVGSAAVAAIAIAGLTCLWGCGSSTPTQPIPLPARVTLSPGSSSLDQGGTQNFTAVAQNSRGVALSPAPVITFVSSNSAVVSIAANGVACAGTWDSLSNPQVCTAGPVGSSTITAVSHGVSSPPTTVYVHPHIDKITVAPVVAPTDPCITRNDTFDYEARAFSQGIDITASVGPINWQTVNSTVVTLSTTASGLLSNQVEATARIPGVTSIFASVSGANSSPMDFTTCLVKSIDLEVTSTGEKSLVVGAGSSAITVTVTDTLGQDISGVPLTVCSSAPAAIGAGNDCAASATTSGVTSFSVTGPKTGGASIVASCVPPRCNTGLAPSRAVYATGPITATRTATATANTSIWVASTACDSVATPNDNDCVSRVVAIDSTTLAPNAAGDLPARPNSFVFAPTGNRAFLGTDSSLLQTKGLTILTPGSGAAVGSTSSVLSASGKVLAVSPNGNLVILSNTTDSPNRVFVVDATSGTPSTTAFQIAGASAAAFSPDGFKAFILAGSRVYVYSTVDALQNINFAPQTPTSLAFLSNGAFAYVGTGSNLNVRKTCDNDVARDAAGAQQTVALPGSPSFLASLPDGGDMLALISPRVDLISVNSAPVGCASPAAVPPGGLPTISHGVVTSFDLGQGNFTAMQMIMSTDGTKVYVLAANLASIAAFDTGSHTSTAIALADNASPVHAALNTEGDRLYVIGSDDKIHVVNTLTGEDLSQVEFLPFPQALCRAKTGTSGTFTCPPDLIAVKP